MNEHDVVEALNELRVRSAFSFHHSLPFSGLRVLLISLDSLSGHGCPFISLPSLSPLPPETLDEVDGPRGICYLRVRWIVYRRAGYIPLHSTEHEREAHVRLASELLRKGQTYMLQPLSSSPSLLHSLPTQFFHSPFVSRHGFEFVIEPRFRIAGSVPLERSPCSVLGSRWRLIVAGRVAGCALLRHWGSLCSEKCPISARDGLYPVLGISAFRTNSGDGWMCHA